ncbi:hypothetical protein Plhal304r1_c027g0091111 [Plasmopara halstedii]
MYYYDTLNINRSTTIQVQSLLCAYRVSNSCRRVDLKILNNKSCYRSESSQFFSASGQLMRRVTKYSIRPALPTNIEF